MVYDPAWDMPQQNWQQQGSFESGEIPPAVAPDAGTPICIGPIAQEWLPFILGAMDQMRNPSSWLVPNDAAMDVVLRRVDLLKEIVATSLGCEVPVQTRFLNCVLETSNDGGMTWTPVPGWISDFPGCVRDAMPAPPPNPGPDPIQQRACNIAGFLATEIVQTALAEAVAEYGHTVRLINFADWVAQHSFAVSLPYAYQFADAVFQLWQTLTAGNIADFTAASTDPTLISLLTCAIYNAIKLDGQVTDANYPTVLANVCAVAYVPASIIPAICTAMTNIGAVNARALQSVGAFEVVDCTSCGIWCWQENFVTAPWSAVSYDPGVTTWVNGIGYVGSYIAVPNLTETGIILTIPPTLVESLEIDYLAALGETVTSLIAWKLGAGAYVIPPTAVVGSTGATQRLNYTVATTIDTILIVHRVPGSVIPVHLQDVNLEGFGPNPFGADTCVP